MILYKDESMVYEMADNADWRLMGLLAVIEHLARLRGCGVGVTSVFRLDGVHGAGRAFDNRFFTLVSFARNYEVGPDIEDELNKKIEYGVGHDGELHPAALWHDAGTGLHLHVQVPDHELILRR